MAASAKKSDAAWKCPKCGREFARKSSYHGCGEYSVEGYLAKKNPAGVRLFNSLTTAAQKFPGVTLSPAKTQISFRVRSNFLMVSVSGAAITGYLFLPQPAPKPYFKKIVAASTRRYVHVFRIEDERTLHDFVQLLPDALELVIEQPSKTQAPSSIGEEINELYRAERRARGSAIS